MATKIHNLDSYRLPAEMGSVVRMPPRPPDGLAQIMALLRHRPEYIPYVAALLDVCEAGKGTFYRDAILYDVGRGAYLVDNPSGKVKLGDIDFEASQEYLTSRKAQLRPAG
jgi:hypothetical protein